MLTKGKRNRGAPGSTPYLQGPVTIKIRLGLFASCHLLIGHINVLPLEIKVLQMLTTSQRHREFLSSTFPASKMWNTSVRVHSPSSVKNLFPVEHACKVLGLQRTSCLTQTGQACRFELFSHSTICTCTL